MTNTNFALTLFLQNQELKVSRFTAYETLSRNFYGKLILLLEKAWGNPNNLLRQNVTLKIRIKEQQRFFNGFIYKVSYTPFPNQQGWYELKLVIGSWLGLFKETCGYHIFEHKTVLEIIAELFKNYPWCQLDTSKLLKQPPLLNYCVQYQESHDQFVQRLLLEAGFNYHYQHYEHRHQLTLTDQLMTEMKERDETLFWQWQSYESLFNPTQRHRCKSTQLDLQIGSGFGYKKQAYQMLQIKHYAHDFSHMHRSSLSNSSTQAYFNHCCVIAENEHYKRPPRAKAQIAGVHNAQVAAIQAKGLTLKYPWSNQQVQKEVPALQALNDDQQKLSFPHLPGTEVLVGYQNNNIEQPLVLAACYNVASTPPFAPKDESWVNGFRAPLFHPTQMQSELVFDNTPQAEQLSLVAARDFKQDIQGEQQTFLKGNYHQKIEGEAKLQTKSLVIKASQISLQTGTSLIKITPQEILVQSKAIHLN